MRHLLSIILLVMACSHPVEPVAKGYYYVENSIGYELSIEAFGNDHQKVVLLQDTAAPNATTKFFRVLSDGHLRPSNFFTEFRVFAILAGTDSLVYEGVKDDDWELRQTGEPDGENYYLVIHQ